MKSLYILLLNLLLLVTQGMQAQSAITRSPLLMPRERSAQLPIHSIHRVIQDSQGYIWFGTVNGLCRDDGYAIKVYRNDYLHPRPMASNHVNCLAEDSTHHIIIGTRDGAYYLDNASQRMEPMAQGAFSGQEILSLAVLGDGTICLNTARKAFLVKKADSAEVLEMPSPAGLPDDWQYYTLSAIDKGETLVAIILKHGPYIYDRKGGSWHRLPHDGQLDYVSDVCQSGGCLWFSSFTNGVQRVTWPVKGQPVVTQIPNSTTLLGATNQENWRIRFSAADSLLWVVSKDDLYALRLHADGRTEWVPALTGFGGAVGRASYQKMLSDIFIDKEGNLHVVNFEGDHFMVSHQVPDGRYYPLSQIKTRFRNDVVVSAACYDPGEAVTETPMLWVSQERIGLCLYNTSDGSVSAYNDNAEMANMPLHWVPCIKPSRTPHRVWVITRPNIVMQVERQGMKMRITDTVDLSNQSYGGVTAIYEDSKGRLWIGTQHQLLLYKREGNSMHVVSADMPAITDLAETSDGRIWACVPGRGLCEVDQQLHCKLHKQEGNHLCLAPTSDGRLWIGTGEGDLLCFSPSEGFRSWASACEFNGDMIDNIAVDNYNHVWVQMNQMLCEFNPNNGAFRKMRCTGEASLETYPSSQDVESIPIQFSHLPLRRFMPKALFRDSQGAVFLGGFGGVLRVQPTQCLEGIPERRDIRLTDVKVMGESLLSEGESISLPCHAQHVEFSFSTLDILDATAIRYACRLEGVDHDWVYLPMGQNTVLYTQLPRGTHRLEVKATDANGLWMEQTLCIDVCREPYWWESTLAFTIYAILTLGILVGGIMLYRRHLRRQNEQLWQDSNAMQALRQYVTSTTPGLSDKKDVSIDFAQLDQQLVEKARSIVQAHMGDANFNVVTLASEMGMSRSTLTRRFKAILDDTPLHFITQMRMDAARAMLSGNRTATVAEVAQRVGFADAKYFASIYRETFGVLPSEEKK